MTDQQLKKHIISNQPYKFKNVRIYEDGQVHVKAVHNGRTWWQFLGMRSDLDPTKPKKTLTTATR